MAQWFGLSLGQSYFEGPWRSGSVCLWGNRTLRARGAVVQFVFGVIVL